MSKQIEVRMVDGSCAFIPGATLNVMLVGFTYPYWQDELADYMRGMYVQTEDDNPVINMFTLGKFSYNSLDAELAWMRYAMNEAEVAVFHLKSWNMRDIFTFGLWMGQSTSGTTILYQPTASESPMEAIRAASVLAKRNYFIMCKEVKEIADILAEHIKK